MGSLDRWRLPPEKEKKMKSLFGNVLHNMGDSIVTIVMWVAYIAICITQNLTSDFLKEIPLLGRPVAWVITHILSWVDGPCLRLAIALTLGLIANLAWDVVAARLYWRTPNKKDAALVPAPGALNWVVAGLFFALFTILSRAGYSIGEFLYWATWWQIALAFIVTSLVLFFIVAVVALVMRRHGLGGGHRRRRR